ncbi:MAG: GNAT family N-acetyltransferase [Jatrophihabitans sp.]|uniref:GNAT family N-acetyltransferase n=1 Tax=Jatrophihabitans sp. TaxID=1932789 RepID=UPI003F7D17D4
MSSDDVAISDNPGEGQFELRVDGELAALAAYTLHDGVADFTHTETKDGFGGRGLASQLITAALDEARARSWHVRPSCPFVRRFVGYHALYLSLVAYADRARFGLPSAG